MVFGYPQIIDEPENSGARRTRMSLAQRRRSRKFNPPEADKGLILLRRTSSPPLGAFKHFPLDTPLLEAG